MPAAIAPAHSSDVVTAGEAARVPAIEWPTVALVVACVAAWLWLTSRYGEVSAWLLAPATAVLLAWHSSIQHELVHGHPTRWSLVNRALGGIMPLSLWIPFERYRTLHLRHHINDRLTDPYDDPESNYWAPERWAQRPVLLRWITELQLTLAGRMLVGSWWRIGGFVRREAVAFVRGEPGVRQAWMLHALACIPVLWWVTVACGIPLWFYVVAMVVPGNAILLIRSFAEHRARPGVQERTATVENARLLGPLFLYNSLHALHHAEPLLPWYRYQRRYRVLRDRLAAENRGLVYQTYFDVARRYLFKPHDVAVHPTGRAPARAQAGSG